MYNVLLCRAMDCLTRECDVMHCNVQKYQKYNVEQNMCSSLIYIYIYTRIYIYIYI